MSDNEENPSNNNEGKSRPKDASDTPVDSAASTPATTPQKHPVGHLGATASPARSSAVTIIGSGKRPRIGSSSGTGATATPYGALGAIPPSPPKFASLEEIVQAATGVKNMALAHEIAVDKEFKIEKADFPPSSFEGTFKSIVHKAFWDLMEEKLRQDPPDLESAVSIFEDIKKMLDAIMMPQHQRLKQQIEEVLDLDVIRQQVDAGTIDVYSYTAFVLNLMSKLCAPVRDDDVKKLRLVQDAKKSGELVLLFRGILECLESMRIDMANFTIQQMRPFIQSQSVEYEKAKFADFLKTQTDGLFYTRAWLQAALDAALKATTAPTTTTTTSVPEQQQQQHQPQQEQQSLSPPPSSSSSSSSSSSVSSLSRHHHPPTPAVVLVDAFVSLLFWDDTLPFPETLVMDEGRLMHLRDEFYRLSLVGAILLVIYNVVGAPIAGLAALKDDLKSKIWILIGPVASEAKENESNPPLVAPFTSDASAVASHRSQLVEKLDQIYETTKICVTKSLADHGFPPPSTTAWDSLKGQIANIESAADNPVVRIVFKRLSTFFKSVMTMEGAKTNVQIPAGLSGLQKEIVDMVASFVRIVTHNRAVFGDYYQDIVHSLTRPLSS